MFHLRNSSQLPFSIVDLDENPEGVYYFITLNNTSSQESWDGEDRASQVPQQRAWGSAGILISIPPAATTQEGVLIETLSKSHSPVPCHLVDGFIIAFHLSAPPEKTQVHPSSG